MYAYIIVFRIGCVEKKRNGDEEEEKHYIHISDFYRKKKETRCIVIRMTLKKKKIEKNARAKVDRV